MKNRDFKYMFWELVERGKKASEEGKDFTLPLDVNEKVERVCKVFNSEEVDNGLKLIRDKKLYGEFEIVDKSGIVVARCKSYAYGIIPNIKIVRDVAKLPFLKKEYYFVNMISELNNLVGFYKDKNDKSNK